MLLWFHLSIMNLHAKKVYWFIAKTFDISFSLPSFYISKQIITLTDLAAYEI